MAATAILHFFQIFIFDVIDMFQIVVPIIPLILVTIGQIVKNWQQFFEIKSKMAATAILNYVNLD